MVKIQQRKKKVVIIGGGKGLSEMIRGFLSSSKYDVTAVVTTMDDGGSSGVLRRELGIVAPGDVRRALLAAAGHETELTKIWEHRFSSGELASHVVGNLILAGLFLSQTSVLKAVKEVEQWFSSRATILPVTDQPSTLMARLVDGTVLKGEHAIDVPTKKRSPIKKIWSAPAVKALPEVLAAIKKADVVLLGPGDLYTSVIPNLLVRGVASSLRSTKAKVVYVCNLFTKFGETDGYRASDFLRAVERYVGKGTVDAILVNIAKPSAKETRFEHSLQREPVFFDKQNFSKSISVVADSFVGTDVYGNGRKYAQAIDKLL